MKKLKKIFPLLKLFILNTAQWGIKTGFITTIYPHCGFTRAARNKKLAGMYKYVQDYLYAKYGNIIEDYKNKSLQISIQKNEENGLFPVWVCWWQGKDNMPPIVKVCYQSICDNANGHPVNLITNKNYGDYVKLPDYILEKVQKGVISVTHLSDILRMALLYDYGGLWLDATILLTAPLPASYNCPLFTIKSDCPANEIHVAECKWRGYFLFGEKRNILFDYMYTCFVNYWKSENMLIHYGLTDHFFMLGYYHIPAIKRLIDDLPAAGNSNENELDDNRLYNRFNMVYRKDSFETIFNERIFHKLNYKGNFQEYDKNGTLTYYGYLLNK